MVPSIQRIPYLAPREQFIAAIKNEGCVIVQNFASLEALEEARKEIEPWLNKQVKNSKVGGEKGSPLSRYTDQY